MNSSKEVAPLSKTAAAVQELRKLGYTWFPGKRAWVRAPGLPLEELPNAPGWYARCNTKAVAKTIASSDGYAFVSRAGLVIQFNLDLGELRDWRPSQGYEDRVCFVPVDPTTRVWLT